MTTSSQPLSPDSAKRELNRCLMEGDVIYTQHFREELSNDNLDLQDVLAVCRSGAIRSTPERDIRTGQWKYRIEGRTTDQVHVAVVFSFRYDSAVLITVFTLTT